MERVQGNKRADRAKEIQWLNFYQQMDTLDPTTGKASSDRVEAQQGPLDSKGGGNSQSYWLPRQRTRPLAVSITNSLLPNCLSDQYCYPHFTDKPCETSKVTPHGHRKARTQIQSLNLAQTRC